MESSSKGSKIIIVICMVIFVVSMLIILILSFGSAGKSRAMIEYKNQNLSYINAVQLT